MAAGVARRSYCRKCRKAIFRLRPDGPCPGCDLSVRGQRIIQLRVPVTPSPRGEIQDVPNGAHEIDAPLLDLGRHPWMGGIEMVNSAGGIPGEDRNGGILT